MKTAVVATLCFFVFAYVAIAAQPRGGRESSLQAAQGLTVEDIVKLTEAGLSEDVIVARIRKNGKAFDLSTDDLLKLKKVGVGNNVLRAMMDPAWESRPAVAPGAPAAGESAAAALPDEIGVYYAPRASREFQRVEGMAVSNMRTGSTLASKMTLGIKRARVNAQLKGPRARLRIKERQPQFYFYLPEDASIGDYVLLKLAVREDVRQIEIGEQTMWKQQAGVDHAMQIEFAYKRVKNRLYSLTPNGELNNGEYGFYIASGVEMKKATGRIYDFGIE